MYNNTIIAHIKIINNELMIFLEYKKDTIYVPYHLPQAKPNLVHSASVNKFNCGPSPLPTKN